MVNISFHLEPNAVNGFADPEHRQYPETSEDVGQNGAKPLQNTGLRGITDDTCRDQRQAESLRSLQLSRGGRMHKHPPASCMYANCCHR